jgi:hypothetical protein
VKRGVAIIALGAVLVLAGCGGSTAVAGRARLTRGSFLGSLAWSPKGVLAAVGATRIVLMAASGRVLGKLRYPSAVGAEGDMFPLSSRWSPNGKQLLVLTGRGSVRSLSVVTVSTRHWQLFPVPNVGRR